MDGFKRPSLRQSQPQAQSVTPKPLEALPKPLPQKSLEQPIPIDLSLDSSPEKNKKPRPGKLVLVIIAALFGLLVFAAVGAYFWYNTNIQPVDTANKTVQRIEIKEGSSLSSVAKNLQDRGVIRSSTAFSLLAGFEGKRNAIKAGTCNLNPAETAKEVLAKITAGCHDFKSVTFYPGATLATSLYAKTKAREAGKEFKDPSIRASLLAAGFSAADIDAAYAANYESPLFADKPANEGYEGYIFGETYYVATDATAQEVLQTAFDHMNNLVKQNDLASKFKSQDLNLYEGITLASIVEKELDCEGKPTEERKNRCYTYQQQIAKVFLNRLELGMSLGSDVTSIYASDKLGVVSSIEVDSPYNTRKYAGLPPGPIATPGKLALLSVANPANTDALYFLAGDDGLIYFARDEAGHTANIKNHCQTLCGDL